MPRADASALSPGDGFACAIVGDGSLRCWGDNTAGQLAQGNTAKIGDSPGESTVRVDLGPGRTAVTVTAGGTHACAILDTGQVRCWGDSGFGQLAQGNLNDIGDDAGETTVPVDLGLGRTAVAVDAGHFHTCAILDTGQLRCWGSNASGQLGQSNTNDIGDDPGETTVPIDLGLGRTATAVSAGGNTTCAILDTGQLRCWGFNAFGQLLQGSTDNIGDSAGETTVPVNLGGQPATAVSVGESHVCALRADGQLRCWGSSGNGELGLGQSLSFGDDPGETSIGPVPLPAGRTAIAVTAGFAHTCAILDSGELRCWGDNNFGQLGQGTVADYGDDPSEFTLGVSIDAPVRSVGAGHGFTCAVTGTGLRCWGWNVVGQLARGSTVGYGAAAGEVPSNLPPINLGGQQVGRDTDGDGVRDAVDACPTVPGTLPNGCTAAAPTPEAVRKGKKVLLDAVLAKRKASARCPAKAKVVVKSKSRKGRIHVTKQLKTTTVATGCRVKGRINLHAKPKASAQVKVTVSGQRLRTKHLVAVRL